MASHGAKFHLLSTISPFPQNQYDIGGCYTLQSFVANRKWSLCSKWIMASLNYSWENIPRIFLLNSVGRIITAADISAPIWSALIVQVKQRFHISDAHLLLVISLIWRESQIPNTKWQKINLETVFSFLWNLTNFIVSILLFSRFPQNNSLNFEHSMTYPVQNSKIFFQSSTKTTQSCLLQ